ncbi:hypothetical protein [Phreatobacter sp.]|uniref:hypothetical protein n=1 Tax=Phreatobacter sp. TaxID=1966341 RepID=UPI0025E528A1|nr:hypothetical protein [Phreatobacter sp.]
MNSLHLPQFKFDSLPQDNREWEVIAAGRVGRPGPMSGEVEAELLLAEAGWRNGAATQKPEIRAAPVAVSWLSGLRPGTMVRNGERVGSITGQYPGRLSWRAVTLTRERSHPVSEELRGFVDAADELPHPAHPIGEFQGLRYFAVRLNRYALAFVPVLELLMAVFRLGGPWLRHMMEGLGLPDRPEAGRLVDLSPESFSVEDGLLTCRGFSHPGSYPAPIPLILGNEERYRSYTAVFKKLSQSDFLNSPQFVDTLFPQNVGFVCDLETDKVRLARTDATGALMEPRRPLLVTRIRTARFESDVRSVRMFVPDRSAGDRDVPTRVSAQIIDDGELVAAQPALKLRASPSRSLEAREFAVDGEQPAEIPISIITDPSRSAPRHYRRKSDDQIQVEGSSTGSPHGRTAKVEPASLQPTKMHSGITSRMQQLIDALEAAARMDGALFRLEPPPAPYDAGDGLWKVDDRDLHKLLPWIRPGGLSRRIAVMSLISREGVLYTFDGESLASGGERSALLVWSPGPPLPSVALYDIIISLAMANGTFRESQIVPGQDPDRPSAARGRTLPVATIRHRPARVLPDQMAKSILRERDRLRGL